MHTTFVYIMQAREYIKIGVTSSSIEKRAKSIQTGCPLPITEIFFFKYESRSLAFKAEKLLHDTYRNHNTHGEWFLAFNSFGSKIEKLLGIKYGKMNYKQFYETLSEDIKIKMINNKNKIKLRQAKRDKLLELENGYEVLESLDKKDVSFSEHRRNMIKMKKINDIMRKQDKIRRKRDQK